MIQPLPKLPGRALGPGGKFSSSNAYATIAVKVSLGRESNVTRLAALAAWIESKCAPAAMMLSLRATPTRLQTSMPDSREHIRDLMDSSLSCGRPSAFAKCLITSVDTKCARKILNFSYWILGKCHFSLELSCSNSRKT